MALSQQHPELLGRTIWQFMPEWAQTYLFNLMAFEVEAGRPLPSNSYPRLVAAGIVRDAHRAFLGA